MTKHMPYRIPDFLNVPALYNLVQNILGAKQGRTRFVTQYVRATAGNYILDIGCGTAQILNHLPAVKYYGFDLNAEYIHLAQKQFGHKATFSCRNVSDFVVEHRQQFDIVIASGVLHHLTDAESMTLLKVAKDTLRPQGRLVTIDPCYGEGQSRVARFIISKDRGTFVRDKEGYLSLATPIFDNVAASVRHDISRIPYTHLILECTR